MVRGGLKSAKKVSRNYYLNTPLHKKLITEHDLALDIVVFHYTSNRQQY